MSINLSFFKKSFITGLVIAVLVGAVGVVSAHNGSPINNQLPTTAAENVGKNFPKTLPNGEVVCPSNPRVMVACHIEGDTKNIPTPAVEGFTNSSASEMAAAHSAITNSTSESWEPGSPPDTTPGNNNPGQNTPPVGNQPNPVPNPGFSCPPEAHPNLGVACRVIDDLQSDILPCQAPKLCAVL